MRSRFTQRLAQARPLARVFASPLLGFLLVVVLAKAIEWTGQIPTRRGSGIEDVILRHQRAAASAASNANLLFVGDSTCLMNLDLSAVPATESGLQPLNLGMLSMLPLPAFAELVAEFAQRNPGRLAYVVLLISPGMVEQEPVALSPAGSSSAPPRTGFLELTGLRRLRDLVQRCLPVVLPGRYGRFYGFDLGLDQFMHRHHGSAIDPGELSRVSRRPHPIEIKGSFREECAAFRAKLPRHCRFFVGLAPVPREESGGDFPLRHEQLTSELATLLGAEQALPLPASYPALLFASSTHLKAQARAAYTSQVWKAVLKAMQDSGSGTGSEQK
ncbi:MAG: hypothetical protein HYY24_29460 [Verrucomicrobia bacterium]|nr:hypothetical protein [Verrucomicrobiota bacterium]